MNLPETLVYTDITHLNRIAKQYELSCNFSSKNDLIQSILQHILNKENISKRIDTLSEAEKHFLTLLLFDDQKGYTTEDLLAKGGLALKQTASSHEAVDASPRTLISTLLQYGWLFYNKGVQGMLYQIPSDLKKRLIASLRTIKNKQEELQNEHEFLSITTSSPMLHDIHRFLKFVNDEMVLITHEGVMYKRFQQQILSLLTVQESLIDKKEWRFGYGRRFHNYPDRFSILYDYCYDRNFIEEGDGCLTVTERGKNVLEGYETIQHEDIYQFWVKLYRKPIRNLSFLLSYLGVLALNRITIHELKSEMLSFIRPFYYDSAEDVFFKRLIKPLIWIGWLESESQENPKTVQLSPWAKVAYEKK